MATNYNIIVASIDWADRWRAFCQRVYQASYARPELGIAADLFSVAVFSSDRVKQYYIDQIQYSDTNRCWLAVDDQQQILGGICARLEPDGTASLHGFYIDPSVRGQGIGSDLYQTTLSFVGDRSVHVDVVEYMLETIAIYEHWGFAIDESKGYIPWHWPEWGPNQPEAYRGVHMVKP